MNLKKEVMVLIKHPGEITGSMTFSQNPFKLLQEIIVELTLLLFFFIHFSSHHSLIIEMTKLYYIKKFHMESNNNKIW